VRRAEPQASSFVVEFDKNFLASLDQEELRAVIAHELGHVWIFTHHPYLQTEALANQKAMEVVGRETLERVYEKVWRIEGQQGTLQEFLVKVENSQQQASR
jgi:predicted SprT family Zn-dependent metalloprotease